MALTVEDGTIVTGADSYISDADASSYVSGRYGAADAFAAADADTREPFLRRAAGIIDAGYRARWKGIRKTQAQPMDWPRYSVEDGEGFLVDDSTVPIRVGYAQAELARELQAGNDPTAAKARGGHVAREKVGPIEVEYSDRAVAETVLPMVDDLLSQYLTGDGMTTRLVRG